MEFPTVGQRCSVGVCEQLDFLPFSCSHCQSVFCKEHYVATSHACPKFVDNTVSVKESFASYRCTRESCERTSPVEMLCVECKLHFCLEHRYHGCLEMGEESRSKELEKWEKPKEEFGRAKAEVDRRIDNSLRKAKNVSVANKVQLMRLKGRAVGPTGIPTVEKCYFLVYPPITGPLKIAKEPKATYVSCRWTLGRIIDSLADTLGVPNANNSSEAKKLRLFHLSSGFIVSQRMDIPLSELIDNTALTNGQSLILEYSNGSEVDSSLYKE